MGAFTVCELLTRSRSPEIRRLTWPWESWGFSHGPLKGIWVYYRFVKAELLPFPLVHNNAMNRVALVPKV